MVSFLWFPFYTQRYAHRTHPWPIQEKRRWSAICFPRWAASAPKAGAWCQRNHKGKLPATRQSQTAASTRREPPASIPKLSCRLMRTAPCNLQAARAISKRGRPNICSPYSLQFHPQKGKAQPTWGRSPIQAKPKHGTLVNLHSVTQFGLTFKEAHGSLQEMLNDHHRQLPVMLHLAAFLVVDRQCSPRTLSLPVSK